METSENVTKQLNWNDYFFLKHVVHSTDAFFFNAANGQNSVIAVWRTYISLEIIQP